VRSVLSAAIAERAPPKPTFANIEDRPRAPALARRDEREAAPAESRALDRVEFLDTLWYESVRAGLEPALMLGLVQVESGFRKYAISIVGARGYTQVMPFWARLIGDGDVSRLFHMQTNLRFGCVILRHYLDREKGDLLPRPRPLQRQPGRPEYPNAVFAAQRRWEYPPR
jgi:soluble lytic murein transglycosylase-like protein